MILSRSFERGRKAGTYLLFGPEGTGRWLLAVSFTALLNCDKPVRLDGDETVLAPCGECRNCRNIFALGFEGLYIAVPIPPHENKPEKAVDLTNEVIEIKRHEPFAIIKAEASTLIPISMTRFIGQQLSRKSSEGIKRVVVIYRMEKMLPTVADALLKMIEEPPMDTTIILITGNPDSLLPTIQSRSQRIKVSPLSNDVIENYLIERHKLSDNRAKLLARIAEGSIGRAVDAIEGSDDEASQRGVALLLFKSLFLDNGADTLAAMSEVLNPKDRGEAEELLRLWQLLIRDCAGVAVSGEDEDVVNVDFGPDIKKLSGYFRASALAACMTSDIKNTLADLRLNVHIQGALMALALRLKAHITAAN